MPQNSTIQVIPPEDTLASFLALEKRRILNIPSWIFETARTGTLVENGCHILHAPSWAIRYGVAFLQDRMQDLIIIRVDSTELDKSNGQTLPQTEQPLATIRVEGAQDQLVLSLSQRARARRWFVRYYIEDCDGAGSGARHDDRIKHAQEWIPSHALPNGAFWTERVSGNPLVCTLPKAFAGQRLYIVEMPYPS